MVLPHFLQDRLGAPECRLVAADHDGQSRGSRTFHPAAHGAIEKADARGAEPGMQVARRGGTHGRAVDHQGPAAQCRRHEQSTTARKSSSAETQITTASQICASSARLSKARQRSSVGQSPCLGAGAIPHARQQARAMEIAGHVRRPWRPVRRSLFAYAFPVVVFAGREIKALRLAGQSAAAVRCLTAAVGCNRSCWAGKQRASALTVADGVYVALGIEPLGVDLLRGQILAFAVAADAVELASLDGLACSAPAHPRIAFRAPPRRRPEPPSCTASSPVAWRRCAAVAAGFGGGVAAAGGAGRGARGFRAVP